MNTFFFDRDRLTALADAHSAGYQTADPFPHVVIDDFLPAEVIDRVNAEFPGPGDEAWHRFKGDQEVKLATDDLRLIPAFTQQLLDQFNSGAMIDFLEQLTGISGLIPDPHLWGGGLHQIETGGLLKVHSDFNWHDQLLLDRRLNLIVYLNDDWDPSWGGALELWNRDMTSCRQRVVPVANRCVVFSTTDYSFHGHPEPLACPPDRTRRSLALYYYSNGRPASETSTSRTTSFQPRPGEEWRRTSGRSTRQTAARFVPPILVDAARSAQRRLRQSD